MGDCPNCAELNCAVAKHLSMVIEDLEKRMDAQIASDQRALQLAERNIGVRLDNLNHWRAETLSERKEQATRREVKDMEEKVSIRIGPLERFQDRFLAILALVSLLSGSIAAVVVKVMMK